VRTSVRWRTHGRERGHSAVVHGQRAQARGGGRGGVAARLWWRNSELAGAEAVACAATVECSAAVECSGAGMDGGSAAVALNCGGSGEITASTARVRSSYGSRRKKKTRDPNVRLKRVRSSFRAMTGRGDRMTGCGGGSVRS
jgi:hypothetical protein